MVEQIAAELKRNLLRFNIIGTTDEDDLIGSFRLINGNTVWQHGGAVQAMLDGSILLLDEMDLGNERLLCLQSILEGKGVYVKKQNLWVTANAGFSIIATGNTKGRGSEDGKFIGTNILNEAFLDRFDFTFVQEYPDQNIEFDILKNRFPNVSSDFVMNLVQWAKLIRNTYDEGAISEVISPRRLFSILKAYSTFNDKEKAINICLSRFDENIKTALFSLYTKIDSMEVNRK